MDWRNRFEYFSGLLSMPQNLDNDDNRLFFTRSCAYRRSVWEAVGGYPEWLYTGEDTLFALRAKQLGCKIAYAPRSLLAWRPRPTVGKLAKMFFLYGRGDGRIRRNGDLRGAFYWLKYHLLWSATLLAGLRYHLFWIVTFLVLAFIYTSMVLPELKRIRSASSRSISREFYVPFIILVRNLSTNLGYLCGGLELALLPEYSENLKAYTAQRSGEEDPADGGR